LVHIKKTNGKRHVREELRWEVTEGPRLKIAWGRKAGVNYPGRVFNEGGGREPKKVRPAVGLKKNKDGSKGPASLGGDGKKGRNKRKKTCKGV